MQFIADFHIHSRFSMATSRDCNPENLHKWAKWKGLHLIGTGDFTHPGWMEELKEKLEPSGEEGLYRLKPGLEAPELADVPGDPEQPVRFMVSGEISSIYKKAGRTRKVHSLIMLPSLAAAERINTRLDAIGNIRSDGRPILGLDAYPLLALVVEECPDAMYVPAHIWTPHFSLFGAMSGFDDMHECYEDLVPHICAVESGLSSDPPMNWRLSVLDDFALISNSDAHSPPNLAREANLFDTDLSYPAIQSALKARDPKRFIGTLEFNPQEGKYHYDGHRKCSVCWKPSQTKRAKGLCPVCGKKLTVGVLHRVEILADRPEGCRPAAARHYESIVPLAEVIGEAHGVGKGTKTVARQYHAVLRATGTELAALRSAPLEVIERAAGPVVAEGVRRMRAGELDIHPGHDGEYGKVSVFREGERAEIEAGGTLFGESLAVVEQKPASAPAPAAAEADEAFELHPDAPAETVDPFDALNPAQRDAVTCQAGPVIVVAGPGTGKTHTLTCRAAHLIKQAGVKPCHIMCVTFTNKAADHMRERLTHMLGETMTNEAHGPTIGTFHSICLDVLQHRADKRVTVLDQFDARAVMSEALRGLKSKRRAASALRDVSLAKSQGLRPDSPDLSGELQPIYAAYQERLREYAALDYDDILLEALGLFESDADALAHMRARHPYVLVDEFQDVNAVQCRLVKLWAGDGENLFVIGDPDQAIYGFRGADHKFFSQLEADFDKARRIALELSYRSTPAILAAAAAVIRGEPGRADVALSPTREGRAVPRSLEVASEKAEGIAIVREIGRMVGGATMLDAHGEREDRALGGAPDESWAFSDVAVLFRTSRQADMLEECFIKEGIPYRVVGQRSFLEAPSVRDALAFLRCVVAPEDRFRFVQCLDAARFGAGRKLSSLVRKEAGDQAGVIEGWVRDRLESGAFGAAAGERLKALLSCLDDWRHKRTRLTPRDAVSLWMAETAQQEDEDLKRLLRLAAGFADWEAFLSRVLLCQDVECERYGGAELQAATLMTLHAAKGLEFPVVFIAGVEEGLIPMRGGDPAEERRLLYVGLTRARDQLVMLNARSRKVRGKKESPRRSRFLDEMPPGLIDHSQVTLKRKPRDRQLNLF